MAKVADFLKENMPVFRTLVKIGKVPPTVMNEFTIYAFYSTLNHIPSKMDRYSFTAESMKAHGMKITEQTVMKAVREMEKAV